MVMNESIFLAEVKQNNGYAKNRESAARNSADSVRQEKEQRQRADEEEKQKRTMEAEPGLERLKIQSAREVRLGVTVHRSKTQQLTSRLRAVSLTTYCVSFAALVISLQ